MTHEDGRPIEGPWVGDAMRERAKPEAPATGRPELHDLREVDAAPGRGPDPVEPEAEPREPEPVEPEAVEPEPEPVEPSAEAEPEPVEPEAVEPEAVEPEAVEPEAVAAGAARAWPEAEPAWPEAEPVEPSAEAEPDDADPDGVAVPEAAPSHPVPEIIEPPLETPDSAGEVAVDHPAPAAPGLDPIPERFAAGRRGALSMARLHLRMGTLALARAELEAFAGAGSLDDDALLDLAEARWRTGDLAGAGEAAAVALGRGREDVRACVIAAEAVHALGRPAEARRYAARAIELSGGALEEVFAGMPRSPIWPVDAPDDDVALRPAPEPEADRAGAPAAAAEAFAGGRAALARGDVPLATLRLSVAMRLDPKFAQGVLTAIGERSDDPMLALVAGDALRILGRDDEALEAWDRARGKPVLPGEPEPVPPWPEDEPAG